MTASRHTNLGELTLRALAVGYLCAVASLLLLGSVPAAWGWRPHLVVGESMSPGIHRGDLLLAAPVDPPRLRAGQVIIFDRAGGGPPVAHRIVGRDASGGLVTRGDANPATDTAPVSPAAVRGVVRLDVPKIGLPVLWLREGRLAALGLWCGVTALAGWVAFRARPPHRTAAPNSYQRV